MDPLDALGEAVGAPVTVHLKDGTALRGELAGYDQHMNLVLAPPETAAAGDDDGDGPGTSGAGRGATGVEDTTIIRGDNVVTINR